MLHQNKFFTKSILFFMLMFMALPIFALNSRKYATYEGHEIIKIDDIEYETYNFVYLTTPSDVNKLIKKYGFGGPITSCDEAKKSAKAFCNILSLVDGLAPVYKKDLSSSDVPPRLLDDEYVADYFANGWRLKKITVSSVSSFSEKTAWQIENLWAVRPVRASYTVEDFEKLLQDKTVFEGGYFKDVNWRNVEYIPKQVTTSLSEEDLYLLSTYCSKIGIEYSVINYKEDSSGRYSRSFRFDFEYNPILACNALSSLMHRNYFYRDSNGAPIKKYDSKAETYLFKCNGYREVKKDKNIYYFIALEE